jgi:hypothetical protein
VLYSNPSVVERSKTHADADAPLIDNNSSFAALVCKASKSSMRGWMMDFVPLDPSYLLISLHRSGHADGKAIMPMKPANVTLQCSSLKAQCRQAPLSGHAF